MMKCPLCHAPCCCDCYPEPKCIDCAPMTAPDNACPVEQVDPKKQDQDDLRRMAELFDQSAADFRKRLGDDNLIAKQEARSAEMFRLAAGALDLHWTAQEVFEQGRQSVLSTLPPVAEVMERVRYGAIGETSTEGPRWYIWKSGYDGNYVGGKIADKASADAIAAELNRLAALTNLRTGVK